MNKQKAIIVLSYFNPIHKGQLECFNNSKAQADKLFVIVNIDYQRGIKVSKEFDLGFANGGDQNNDTIPERLICEEIKYSPVVGLLRNCNKN